MGGFYAPLNKLHSAIVLCLSILYFCGDLRQLHLIIALIPDFTNGKHVKIMRLAQFF